MPEAAGKLTVNFGGRNPILYIGVTPKPVGDIFTVFYRATFPPVPV